MLENIKSDKTRTLVANGMLLLAALMWGGNFVAMKTSISGLPLNWFNFLRHALAALLLSWVLIGKKLDWQVVWRGALVGLINYGTVTAQNYGLLFTTAGKCALITGSYVVMVPLLNWALTRQKPPTRVLISAAGMVVGIGLLSLQDDLSVSFGDMIVLVCAVLCAVSIIVTERSVKKCDPMQFSFITIAACGVYSLIGALLFEPFPAQMQSDVLFPLLYSGIFGVMLSFVLMNLAMRHANADYASLFMSTESAFGALFGVLLLGEVLTGRMTVGCVLVLAALFFSQVSFKRKGEVIAHEEA